MRYINKLKVFYTLFTLIINSLLFSQTVDPTLFNKIQYTLEEVGETSFLNGDIILINGAEYKIVPIVPNGLSSQNNPAFIQTGNNLYATPLVTNGSLDISILGGVYGELGLSNDYLTAKSIRQNNRDVIRNAAEFCKYYGYELFVASRYEIWQVEDSTAGNQLYDNIFELEEGQSLTIKGNRGSSKIKLYPKAKTHIWTDTDILALDAENGDYSLIIKDIIIEGRDYWYNWFETYPVQVNVTASGSESTVDANIYIPTSVTIREGFWEDLEIGDKIILEECKYYLQAEGVIFELESFDESTRTLNWSSNLIEDTNWWREQADGAYDDTGDSGFWPESLKIGVKLGESLDPVENSTLPDGHLPDNTSNYVRFEGAERQNYPNPSSEEWGAAMIGVAFKRLDTENISNDDLTTYGAAWRDDRDREDAFNFTNLSEDYPVVIDFEGVVLTNWGTVLSGSFANGTILVRNSTIKTSNMGMQLQRREGINPVSRIKLSNVDVYDFVHLKQGGGKSGNRNFAMDNTDPFLDIRGEFTYNSPSVEHDWSDMTISDINRFSSQQRSASVSPSKASTLGARSIFRNIVFNAPTVTPTKGEGAIITSPSMPSYFQNIIFNGSALLSQSELYVSDSRFINTEISQYGLNKPTQIYGTGVDRYAFTIKDTEFLNSSIDVGQATDYFMHSNPILKDLFFEETDEGLGNISIASKNAVISNITVDLSDNRTPDNTFGFDNNFILMGLDNLADKEKVFEPSGNNIDAFNINNEINILVDNITIIYPSDNIDDLYDFNLIYPSGNIGLVNHKIQFKNSRVRSGYLCGTSAKPLFKHNLTLEDIQFVRVGDVNGFKLKNLVGGIIESGVDANNDLVFDASKGSGVYLDATTLRAIKLRGQSSTGVLNLDMWNYDGEFVIIPKSDVTLTPYSINTDSNIDTDITTLEEGERYTFKHIYKGEGFLTSDTKASKTVTLVASADGTQRTWNNFNEQFDNEPDDFNWILESAVLDVGGTTYKVNSEGKVISPDGNIRGCFSNYNGMYTLYFKDAPAATTVITLTYDYYPTVDHDDYWILK